MLAVLFGFPVCMGWWFRLRWLGLFVAGLVVG